MKKLLFIVLFVIPVFSFSQVAVIIEVTGVVKINNKTASKKMSLKEGDKIEVLKDSKAVILYSNNAMEIVKNSKIIVSQARALKVLKIQKETEIVKGNISIRGSESIPLESMTPRQVAIEKLISLFANKKYQELILFINETNFNYQHPDHLFRVAFSYFQLGDFSKAAVLFNKLYSYDVPEYNKLTKTILQACAYFKTGKKPEINDKNLEALN